MAGRLLSRLHGFLDLPMEHQESGAIGAWLGRDLVSIGRTLMKTSVSRTFFWEKPREKASLPSENGWNRDDSPNPSLQQTA
jgi:hypothetical protein